MENEFYISHIIPEEIPKQGLRKIFFYTKKGEKYFYGKGQNSNYSDDQKFIDSLEARGKIKRLPQTVKLEDKKGIWLDNFGKLHSANLINPLEDKTSKCIEGIVLK